MSDSDSVPIAVFHEEIRWLISREFELYTDRIKVRGIVRGTRSEATVLLADLPEFANHIWLRTKHHKWSAVILAILSVFLIVPFLAWPPSYPLLGFGLLVNIPAVCYFIQSLPTVEFAQFVNPSRILLLDMAKSGPDVARFDEFVTTLERQIGIAKTIQRQVQTPAAK